MLGAMDSTSGARPTIRAADPGDAVTVATLLHDFNIEYDTPTPDVTVLTARLRRLLAGGLTFAVLAGRPEVGVALVTLRTSLWYEGFVATLDELYVAPGHRGQGTRGADAGRGRGRSMPPGGDVVEINVDGDGGGAPRFYERHGYRNTEVGDDVPLLYYFRELERGVPDAR